MTDLTKYQLGLQSSGAVQNISLTQSVDVLTMSSAGSTNYPMHLAINYTVTTQ